MTKWYEDRNNLYFVAEILVEECLLRKAEDVVRYIEKPWKWDKEAELILGHEGTREELEDKLNNL